MQKLDVAILQSKGSNEIEPQNYVSLEQKKFARRLNAKQSDNILVTRKVRNLAV